MEQEQNVLDQAGAGEMLEQTGIPHEVAESEVKDESSLAKADDPHGVKKRLAQQAKRHQKEMREMQSKLHELSSRMQPQQENSMSEQNPMDAVEDEKIQRAVRMALAHKNREEQEMAAREKQAHVHKQYQNLQDHLEAAHDKYDDFHEKVMADDVPFTTSMRDTALLLPNAADVLYKLGDNRSELERISKLHPLEQSKEMIKLSHALISGANKSQAQMNPAQTVGQIKSNPVNTSSVNEKTSVGELRRKMKANWR